MYITWYTIERNTWHYNWEHMTFKYSNYSLQIPPGINSSNPGTKNMALETPARTLTLSVAFSTIRHSKDQIIECLCFAKLWQVIPVKLSHQRTYSTRIKETIVSGTNLGVKYAILYNNYEVECSLIQLNKMILEKSEWLHWENVTLTAIFTITSADIYHKSFCH